MPARAVADHYEALQVDPTADDVVIQAAYRVLMKRHHPDRGGDPAVARRLNLAYATLGDPRARGQYDRARAAARAATARAPHTVELRVHRPLAADLGATFQQTFAPIDLRGLGWVFDYGGALRGAGRHRIWMKRLRQGDLAGAGAFQRGIKAARLLRPMLSWGSDLFVAVLEDGAAADREALRAPRGLFARFGSAVVALDMATREVIAAPGSERLPTVGALRASLRG